MKRPAETKEPKGQGKPADRNSSREAQLDEALDETFPASDPVSLGHSDHAGVPPNHRRSAEDDRKSKRKRP